MKESFEDTFERQLREKQERKVKRNSWNALQAQTECENQEDALKRFCAKMLVDAIRDLKKPNRETTMRLSPEEWLETLHFVLYNSEPFIELNDMHPRYIIDWFCNGMPYPKKRMDND